jgi:hypothetical protein
MTSERDFDSVFVIDWKRAGYCGNAERGNCAYSSFLINELRTTNKNSNVTLCKNKAGGRYGEIKDIIGKNSSQNYRHTIIISNKVTIIVWASSSHSSII